MKSLTYLTQMTLSALLLLAGCMVLPGSSSAQSLPCSWPLKTDGTGLSNLAYPDTNATYWTMPFDAGRWRSMTVTGRYPQSRFMSLNTYNTKGDSAAALIDYQIDPDPGSRNPFREDEATSPEPGDNYTITISKSPDGGSNQLQAGSGTNSNLGWVIYRLYVPDKGENERAGVPLPQVTLIDHQGGSHALSPCGFSKFAEGIHYVLRQLAADGLTQEAQHFLHQVRVGDYGPAAQARCSNSQPPRAIFAIPEFTGGYFPNEANKYMAAPGLCHEPDMIVVVRGKAPGFPDTYHHNPVWQPAPGFPSVQLRYFSMCNNEQVKRAPVVACQADYSTTLDADGYYTYVLAPAEGKRAPQWIPPDATWIPWGRLNVPNVLIFRNMLPSTEFFNESIQGALTAGCVFNNTPPVPPDAIPAAGECASDVMKDYYPKGVICSKAVFTAQGWQGCFAAEP